MLTSLRQLSKLRKHYLAYEFLSKSTYVFLISVTVGLLSSTFGANGLVIKDWMTPVLGLAVFLPGLSRYVIKNPVRSYTWIVTIEILCILGFWLTEWNIYPDTILLASLGIMMALKSVITPLRDKNNSQVIKSCGEFSLLRGRINALSAVVLGGIGGLMVLYSVPTVIGVALTTSCLILSRYMYVLVMKELYVIENGRAKGYAEQ